MKREDVETLKQAIMAEAKRDWDRILQEAQGRAQAIRQQAETDAEKQAADILAQAHADADRMQQQAVGSAKLEAQGLRAHKREELLNEVFERASERLAALPDSEDYPEIVTALVTDAARRLGGSPRYVILADETTRELLDDEMLEKLGAEAEATLSLGDTLEEGRGVILRAEGGRLRYDNTFEARLARMRTELRAAVYRVLIGEAV